MQQHGVQLDLEANIINLPDTRTKCIFFTRSEREVNKLIEYRDVFATRISRQGHSFI